MNRSVGVIDAPAAWAAAEGSRTQARAVKIGVLDNAASTRPIRSSPTNTLTPPAGFPKFDPGNQQFTSRK